jgi:acetylglutamate kinase
VLISKRNVFINRYLTMLKVVKIGGNIVDNPAKLRMFLADFASLPGDKIVVHGGGKIATAISTALGIETIMVDGRRVTDARTLEVVTMVYNGINKQIVSILQGFECNAVGLCGADGRLVVSRRRNPEPINYGFVGDPVAVNTAFARLLIAAAHTLVVAPITLDGDAANPEGATKQEGAVKQESAASGLLNTNADTVAQAIAVALAADVSSCETVNNVATCNVDESDAGACNIEKSASVELIYCFEKQGVMLDVSDESSVIPRIDKARFEELKASGAVHSGMLPKLENAFRALESGVEKVVICAAENIAKPGYGGTTIVK